MDKRVEIEEEDDGVDNARIIRARMLRLLENEDYKFLFTQMQANLDASVSLVFRAPQLGETELANTFVRGEVVGFQKAMGFATQLLNGAQSTIQMYGEEEAGDGNGEA